MPNGEAAVVTSKVESGLAHRIGRTSGGTTTYTHATSRGVSSKAKGYSTERAQKATKRLMGERGMLGKEHSDRNITKVHKNRIAKKRRTSKGRKRKAS